MHFARAIGGDDDDRRVRRFNGAELRHSDLEVGKHFQKECFEGLVGAVDFVDQQHRRAGRIGLKRLQKRPLDQKAFGKYVVLDPRSITLAFGFCQTNGNHLGAVVPLVDRGGNIQALVTLQTDQAAPERFGQHLGDLGLADPGLALDKQRPAHLAARDTVRSPASDRRCNRPWPAGRGLNRSNWEASYLPCGDFILPRACLTCGDRRPRQPGLTP